MRIFCVFFHPDPAVSAVGGAEKRFLKSLGYFRSKGVEATVVETKPSLLARFGISDNVFALSNVISTSSRGGWLAIYVEWVLWTFKACVKCLRFLRGQKYHALLSPNNTLPNLAVAYFARFISRSPLCIVVHHMDILSSDTNPDFSVVLQTYRKVGYGRLVSLVKALAFFVILELLRRSDECITVSLSTAKVLVEKGVSAKRVHVNGNGIDASYIDSFRFEGRKLYDGVFVGRIAREKGIFDLVKAWRKIVYAKDDACLLVIGSGPDIYKLKRAVEELGLDGNVIVRGPCSDEEMYAHLKASKVFVFPSFFEGWGLAVGEALACGLPVVCYDVPALREVFGDCESVFLVPVGDTEKLASAVLKILETNKTERLVEASKKYSKRFSWDNVAAKDMQIIRGLGASFER